MNIGDIVKYMPSEAYMRGFQALGLIMGKHMTRNQYGWKIMIYHIKWFNDGTDTWTEANSITHESQEYIEVYSG